MAMSKRKGGAFERHICKELSFWWSRGKRDDIFWRTHSSGGRATQRAKQGKRTRGQYCDIKAEDISGVPLMRFAVIECKDGYPGQSIGNLFDKTAIQHPTYEKWFEDLSRKRKQAKTLTWLLIARQKNKNVMIYMPKATWHNLYIDADWKRACCVVPQLELTFRRYQSPKYATVFGTTLETFFGYITPIAVHRQLGKT